MQDTDRYRTDAGTHVLVQVPEADAQRLLDAVTQVLPLDWGDYDRVSFRTAPGIQTYRSRGGGRNPATPGEVEVPCCEVSFFVPGSADLDMVVRALYDIHPYEEPVIFLTPTTRTRHIRGVDEENPNRFWNRPAAEWVPEALRDKG
ncbi:hypothetical protein [Mesobaculum littorinae]|nr:hypothetical protein [Mesobaculum littorinae]